MPNELEHNIEQALNEFSEIYVRSEKDLKHLESWPYYYRRRYLEFLSYYEFFKGKTFKKTLEVGCGVGFYSAFLSVISEKVIATDLMEYSNETHTPGLFLAEKMIKNKNLNNVEIVPASMDSLPFENNSFDFVFASHVLEHTPDRLLSLNEVYRVLQPGGMFFCVVPSRADRFHCFFSNQLYLLKRVFGRFSKSDKKKYELKESGSKERNQLKSSPYLKAFPFPPPHGAYKNCFEEFKQWSPGNWSSLFLKSKFKLSVLASTQINPLFPLIASISHKLALRMYASTYKKENRMGRKSFFRQFGINVVIVAKK